MSFQENVREMCYDNIKANITSLIYNHPDIIQDEDALFVPNYETTGADNGYDVNPDPDLPGWFYYNDPDGEGSDVSFPSEQDAWKAVCEENGLDVIHDEPNEFYIVTEWLANKLADRGEGVFELYGNMVWGRTGGGQAIYIDWVMEDIYRKEVMRDD